MDEGDAAIVAAPAPRRAPRRKPAARWSKKAQARFIAALGESCNVSAACRAAKLSDTTVYRRRRQDPAFLAEWQAALREGVARLEAELLDRALNGVEKAVWHGGRQVGSVRHHSDALALALLKWHAPSVGRDPPAPPASHEERCADIEAMLGEMNLRMGGAG